MADKEIVRDTVLAAKSGNREAIKKLLKIYAPFVVDCAKCTIYDESGKCHEVIDEGIKRRIEAKLAYYFVYDCNPRGVSQLFEKYT